MVQFRYICHGFVIYEGLDDLFDFPFASHHVETKVLLKQFSVFGDVLIESNSLFIVVIFSNVDECAFKLKLYCFDSYEILILFFNIYYWKCDLHVADHFFDLNIKLAVFIVFVFKLEGDQSFFELCLDHAFDFFDIFSHLDSN